MKFKCTRIVFLMFALATSHFIPQSTFAQVRSQIFTGTRPLSMGEAFVAVADDGNAIYWNPAGLARMERIQVSFNYADLFGLGINNYYASFITRLYFIPTLTDYLTLGADWLGIQTGDDELEFRNDQLNFSLAFRPPKSWPIVRHLGIGANAKYLKLSSKLDGRPEADAGGWGGDLGFLYNLSGLLRDVIKGKQDPSGRRIPPALPAGLHVGVMIHDVGGTKIQHKDTDVTEPIHRQNIRWGISYRPFEDWPGGGLPISDPVFALDFDDRVHFGLEFWLAQVLALRAGIQKDLHTDESATFSFGLGFKISPPNAPATTVDWALTDSPVLPNTNKQFGGSFILRDDPRLLRIAEAHINDVFVSLYPHYEKPESKFGSIKIENVHSDSIIASITFKAGDYTQKATPDRGVVPPGATVDHDLRAAFKSDILYTREKRLSGELKIKYEYKKQEFTAATDVDFALHQKNFLTWDDPAKACSFVTPADSSVRKFVSQVKKEQNGVLVINSQVSQAMTLFEALSAYGLEYALDPNHPFTAVLKQRYYLDTVKYPNEFLNSDNLEGDCDDLSVLYAALLEASGISTALLSVPGHLFMMFNTAIPSSQRYRFLVEDDMVIEKSGSYWIPVEMTWIDSTFAEAWAEGARRFAEYDSSELEIVFVQDGWVKYGQTPPDVSAPAVYAIPDLSSKVANSLSEIEGWNDKYLKDHYFSVLEKQPNNTSVRNLLGILYAQNARMEEAEQQFELLYNLHAKDFSTLNNLGNAYFMQAKYEDAERFYRAALEQKKYGGVYLNLSMLYHWWKYKHQDNPELFSKYDSASAQALNEAGRLLNENTNLALQLLGFADEPVDEDKGKAGISAKDWKKLWRSFKKTFHDVFKPKKKENQKLVRVAAPKAGEPDANRAVILWWSI